MACSFLFENTLDTAPGVEVQKTQSKGKGLFTKQMIREGDAILTERPIVCCQFSWNRSYNYTACHHCMKSLETAQNMCRRLSSNYALELPYTDTCCVRMTSDVPPVKKCPRCSVPFCSDECYDVSMMQYHKVLCQGGRIKDLNHPLNRLDEAWKKSHYPPETATVMLVARIAAMVEQSDNPNDLLARFSQFLDTAHDDHSNIAHKLLGPKFTEQVETITSLFQDLRLGTEHMPKLKTVVGMQSMFALIGMNGQGIGTSSVSQYVTNVDNLTLTDEERVSADAIIDQAYEDMEKVSGQFLNCEGSGLFQLASCTNHSCEPNAEVTFPHNSSTMVMVALRDIAADEEICISYLDDCQRGRSRHSRRKHLRENYVFECLCQKCEGEVGEVSETSEEDIGDDDEEWEDMED